MFIALVILALVVIALVIWSRRERRETMRVPYKGRMIEVEVYRDSVKIKDAKASAEIMADIEDRIHRFIEHLSRKYPLDAESLAAKTCMDCDKIVRPDNVDDLVNQLKNRFDDKHVYEILPGFGSTSYTIDKEKFYFCLRSKQLELITDANNLMFVVLHEMTHMMMSSYGHGSEFWVNFKFLIKEASLAGVYNTVNYGVKPWNYCGTVVNNNPYYDDLSDLGENDFIRKIPIRVY